MAKENKHLEISAYMILFCKICKKLINRFLLHVKFIDSFGVCFSFSFVCCEWFVFFNAWRVFRSRAFY